MLESTDRKLEALLKTREHVADVAALTKAAEEHLKEGRFEETSACPRLIKQHAAIGGESLSQPYGDDVSTPLWS